MRRYHACCLSLFLLIGPVRAAEPAGRIVLDIWNAAYLEGARGGYVHTSVHELEQDGQKLYRAVTRLNLTIKRNGATIQLGMDTGDEETAQGKVTGVWMRQYQGELQQLLIRGTVTEGQLAVTIEGKARREEKIPWDDHVLGLYGQERLFRERKVKSGDEFPFLAYEPSLNRVIANHVTVKDLEETEVFGIRKRLLRVETLPEKIGVPGASIQLPGLVTWLDKDWRPIRSQFDIPQLGTLVLYRCSKEEALRRPVSPKTDIGQTSLIRINRAIDSPNQTRSAVYRITVKGDEDPATAFSQDNRQECKNVKGQTFELTVHAIRTPASSADAGTPSTAGFQPSQKRPIPPTYKTPPTLSPKEEFVKSCYWIDSDNPQIRAYGRQAVGERTDPWERAKAIERWVNNHMSLSYAEPFAPASEAAKTLKGDCRQYGLLTTALCRAAGLPARTALGLCYAYDRKLGPVMAFHMWTEVFVRGEWVAIDATRGQGYVGATHLKITDSSWYDTQSLAPLLPVFRVLGKLSIEVVRVDAN
jgi:transglutaminase-like putative cysteine protease